MYGCGSYSYTEPILILQKKILKFVRKQQDSCWEIFKDNQVFSVFELHIYELLKFVLKSVIEAHKQDYIKEMFWFQGYEINPSTENTGCL